MSATTSLRINKELRAWRDRRNLSRLEAAETLGLPVRTLEAIEDGRPCHWGRMLLAHLKLHDAFLPTAAKLANYMARESE